MTVTVYGIANCDTVKKARAWLAEHGVAHDFHDYKKAGVPAGRLDAWIDTLGWQPLVNRQGLTWRRIDEASRAAVVDRASARALLLREPSLLKRPLVEWADGRVTLGFDAQRWQQPS
jgi:arsenate reductase